MPLVSSNLLHAFVFVYKWLSGSPAAYSALLLNWVQCTCADNYAGFLLPIGISLRFWCYGDERHSPNSGKYLAAWQQDSVQGLEWNALTDWGNPLMGIRRSDSPGVVSSIRRISLSLNFSMGLIGKGAKHDFNCGFAFESSFLWLQMRFPVYLFSSFYVLPSQRSTTQGCFIVSIAWNWIWSAFDTVKQ